MRAWHTMLAAAAATVLQLPHVADAHMPAFGGPSSRAAPVDLGDVTANSWAVCTELKPKQVQYYKVDISGQQAATKQGDLEGSLLWLGLYVPPGDKERNFRYYVGFWGLSTNSTQCQLWDDGWGRRRLATTASPPWQLTSSGTTIVSSNMSVVPSRVLAGGGSAGDLFSGSEILTFNADPTVVRPNKFEPFTPTVFKPRGSCVAEWPRNGEYGIAIWGDDSQAEPGNFCLGLGLTERDVFAFKNLVIADYTLWGVHRWNHWSAFVLLLPILLAVALCWGGVAFLNSSVRFPENSFYTVFRGLVLTGGAILIGHSIQVLILLSWAASVSDSEGGWKLVAALGVLAPFVLGSANVYLASGLPRGCCLPANGSHLVHWHLRVVVGCSGLFHLFMWHAGYIIAPVLLLVAACLPAALANYPRAPPKDAGAVEMDPL